MSKLFDLSIYLLLLLGFNSKLGKIPKSLQTQTYFSQIHPSWCLQATTVVDPPLFFDQNEAQKRFFCRPPPPLSQGLDDAPPPLSEGLDSPLNNILINSRGTKAYVSTSCMAKGRQSKVRVIW